MQEGERGQTRGVCERVGYNVWPACTECVPTRATGRRHHEARGGPVGRICGRRSRERGPRTRFCSAIVLGSIHVCRSGQDDGQSSGHPRTRSRWTSSMRSRCGGRSAKSECWPITWPTREVDRVASSLMRTHVDKKPPSPLFPTLARPGLRPILHSLLFASSVLFVVSYDGPHPRQIHARVSASRRPPEALQGASIRHILDPIGQYSLSA